jgi:hypothetical protein
MPLGGKLVRAPGSPTSNVFNLTVPRVRIFDLVCEPRLVCTVTHATSPSGAPSVRIESRRCELKGSPFIESLSKCYDFHVVTHFTWTEKMQHAQGAPRPTCLPAFACNAPAVKPPYREGEAARRCCAF